MSELWPPFQETPTVTIGNPQIGELVMPRRWFTTTAEELAILNAIEPLRDDPSPAMALMMACQVKLAGIALRRVCPTYTGKAVFDGVPLPLVQALASYLLEERRGGRHPSHEGHCPLCGQARPDAVPLWYRDALALGLTDKVKP